MENISHPLLDQTTTVGQIYSYVDSRVDTAKSRWGAFGNGAAAAYASAHTSIQTVLLNCKAHEQARIAREAAQMSFAISLLTVGIGGDAVGALIKKGVSNSLGLSEAKAKTLVGELFTSFAERPLKDASGAAIKYLDEKLKDAVLPTVSTDAFSVCGLNPTQYGETLKESINRQFVVLCGLKEGLADAAISAPAALDTARTLAKRILGDTLLATIPADNQYSTVLVRPAKVALWLAWGRARDQAYWSVRVPTAVSPFQRDENESFQPIRMDMTQLGLGSRVTTEVLSIRGGSEKYMDMHKLAKWASSVTSFDDTFSLLPPECRSLEWFQRARAKFLTSQMLKGTVFAN